MNCASGYFGERPGVPAHIGGGPDDLGDRFPCPLPRVAPAALNVRCLGYFDDPDGRTFELMTASHSPDSAA